ncbi:bifunctional DNA primase/polymerase [Actinosynnema sp. NPDC023587]|uniref:bifunctional DNA primase/polymerase n=1 Tax=Actinosynnema sp. NPDC023587 TaxID=3154695 RepID=UPI0033F1BA6F
MLGNVRDVEQSEELRKALEYAEMGWPVLPGAVWHDGHFVDPANGEPTESAMLRPIDTATTDPDLIHEWWSSDGLQVPAVLGVTGPKLSAVTVYETLAEVILGHKWFATRPTPMLGLAQMPLAYFLVRPPVPVVMVRDDVRVLPEGTTLPLPPTAVGQAAASWLVSPEEAGNVLLLGDEFADMVAGLAQEGR